MELPTTPATSGIAFWSSLEGRIPRSTYWVGFMLPLMGLQFLAWGVDSTLAPPMFDGAQAAIRRAFGTWALYGSPFAGPVSALVYPVLLWIATAGTVRRLHDVGLTGWIYPALVLAGAGAYGVWVLFPDSGAAKVPYLLVALVSLPIGILVCFVEGERGQNRYGENPIEGPATDPLEVEIPRGVDRG